MRWIVQRDIRGEEMALDFCRAFAAKFDTSQLAMGSYRPGPREVSRSVWTVLVSGEGTATKGISDLDPGSRALPLSA